MPEEVFTVCGADGDKIRPRSGIIVICYANLLPCGEIIHIHRLHTRVKPIGGLGTEFWFQLENDTFVLPAFKAPPVDSNIQNQGAGLKIGAPFSTSMKPTKLVAV